VCYTRGVQHVPLPAWTMLPFVALVLSMAILPILVPHAWERRWFQLLVVALCSVPVLVYLSLNGLTASALHAGSSYLSFIATLAALFVTTGGIYVMADVEATPGTNVLWLGLGALLASLIGTTGASMLLIRPLLRINSEREHTGHLVPFFILAVANAGGLLTPLGDPPLLVGFIAGVPFFWTLRLLPVWILYVGFFLAAFYIIDRRAYARESALALARDRAQIQPLELRGRRNVAWLLSIVPAAFLPAGVRELAMLMIAAGSYLSTAAELRERNGFSFAPILEVALLFAGLFACLVPIEQGLASYAPSLPIQSSWQLFWASGSLSALLDNAPTYAAFAALARGLSSSTGELVSGIEPLKLAAISAGSVVMGATTYIGNGPNLMVKAIAERGGYKLPSFLRYFLFAFAAMLPAHLLMTAAFWLLER
jgi:Na+/H+ antiporter NhaD/arsenite permease-like protein